MLERTWSQGKSLPLLAGVQTCTTLENCMAVSQKIGDKYTPRPAIPLLGIYPKDVQSYTRTLTFSTMFIKALFIIVRT